MTRTISIIVLLAAALLASAAAPEVIAHRGYWLTDGSAQNSIRSLIKADSVKCYGSEFDVWLTADGVPVVNHDADINGVRIQTSAARDVLAQGLKNGERISTLWEYLDSAATLSTRLVLEMKEHTDKAREADLVHLILAMVKIKELEDRIEYITFSKEGLYHFIEYAPPGTPVYYLNGDLSPQELKDAGAAGLDYSLKTMKAHPQWIQEAHDLGLKVNVWTVNKEEDMLWCIEKNVDFITTNEPELLISILERRSS